MATRKPLVLVAGQLQELPSTDSFAKADVGLGNVDNTSDANKPISTATQTALNAKEGAIAAGTAAQFWRGDKSWRDFFTDVRAATLTGLSTATNAVVAATDTVLAAIGKLQAQVSAKFDKTGGDVNGNINVTGTGRRITGRFGGPASLSNQLLVQTNLPDSSTGFYIIPNGTANLSAFGAFNKSDPEDSSSLYLYVNNAVTGVSSIKTGTGTYLPLVFEAGGAERLRIDPTTGSVLATSGAIGYGAGAGGTVIQGSANGKNTPVALNKLCGAITMDSQTLAPGATATFNFSNSTIGPNSMLFVQTEWGVGSDQYSVRASVSPFGNASISLKNETTSNRTEAVNLRFFVFNGVTS